MILLFPFHLISHFRFSFRPKPSYARSIFAFFQRSFRPVILSAILAARNIFYLFFTCLLMTNVILGETWGSQGEDYEDGCLLRCYAEQSGRCWRTFHKSLLPPSSIILTTKAVVLIKHQSASARLHRATSKKAGIFRCGLVSYSKTVIQICDFDLSC